jgi:ABC-2 type transport system permease protein
VISLLGSEFLRIRSRRIVWVLALLVIGGMVLGTVLLAAKTHPASAASLATAHASYERDLQRCVSGQLNGAAPPVSNGSTVVLPDRRTCLQDVRLFNYLPLGTFGMVLLPQVFQHSAFILIVIGLVIGSSSIGADWQSGSISTLLTWETRRTRLWVARVVVVCLAVFALALVLLALLTGLLALAAATRGTFAWLDGSWARDAIETACRVAAMSSFGALLGLSVAMIGRSTGAALAGVFVYLAVFESLLRAIYPKIAQWLLGPNVVVFVQGIATSPGTQQILSVAHSVLVISLFALVPFALALLWFRTRDVGN